MRQPDWMKQHQPSEPLLDMVGSTSLSQAGLPANEPRAAAHRVPASGVAARLVQPVREAGTGGLVFIARNEGQAEELASCFQGFMPGAQVILLPPWDCLPY